MANIESRRIVAGPSREELFDALRLRHEGRKVTFTVMCGPLLTNSEGYRFRCNDLTIQVQVDQLGIEDGSGNNWLFKLYDQHAALGSQYLEGYINITRREGWIKPVVN